MAAQRWLISLEDCCSAGQVPTSVRLHHLEAVSLDVAASCFVCVVVSAHAHIRNGAFGFVGDPASVAGRAANISEC